MLLTKEVQVKLWGSNIKHYHDLGYKGKQGDIITVKVEDLPDGSNVRLSVACDYCGAECNPRYVSYRESIETDGTYACKHCTMHKAEKTMYKKYGVANYSSTQECREKVANTLMSRYGIKHVSESEEFLKRKCDNNKEKYGVEHTLQVKEFRDKGIQTNLKKYGVEHVLQNHEIKERMQNTMKEKYGTPYVSQNLKIREKISQTNLERYGCECVLQSHKIREKISNTIKNIYGVDNVSKSDEIKKKKMETMLVHYGVEHPSFSNEILEKRLKTFYKNGTISTSKQQVYLYSLYGGELNYPVSHHAIDICFPEEKIALEYDGGFHDGRVKMGRLTQEEFDQKEIIRNNIIKREGYKIMRIVSRKDLLPSDSTLLQMLSEAKEYFSKTDHHWCTYDIDQSLLFSAEHKDGIYYDFCELRTIKDSDINTIKDNDLNTPRKEDDNYENVLR